MFDIGMSCRHRCSRSDGILLTVIQKETIEGNVAPQGVVVSFYLFKTDEIHRSQFSKVISKKTSLTISYWLGSKLELLNIFFQPSEQKGHFKDPMKVPSSV